MRSAGELESVKNFYSLSAPTSLSSVHHQIDDWPSWNDWIAQPGMLKKLTQIENEMDECLLSVDADGDVADTASSLRRTYSENVRCKSTGGMDDENGCHITVATSKSDQVLSSRCSRKQTQSAGGETLTSGIQLTDDDDAADGCVFLDVFPVPAAPVVITSPDTDIGERSHSRVDVAERGTAATDSLGSFGIIVSGLARSTSDVTSQRRFRRRRSAVRCPAAVAPVTTSHFLTTPRHGHSCSAIDDSLHCDAMAPDYSNDSPQPEAKDEQLVLEVLEIGDDNRVSLSLKCTTSKRRGVCPTLHRP